MRIFARWHDNVNKYSLSATLKAPCRTPGHRFYYNSVWFLSFGLSERYRLLKLSEESRVTVCIDWFLEYQKGLTCVKVFWKWQNAPFHSDLLIRPDYMWSSPRCWTKHVKPDPSLPCRTFPSATEAAPEKGTRCFRCDAFRCGKQTVREHCKDR